MKRLILILALLPVTCWADLRSGLVGHWTMDGVSGTVVPDISTGGNSGTASNSPSFVRGKTGDAVSLNGTTQYVTCGHILDGVFTGASAKFTITAWVYASSVAATSNNTITTKSADSGCSENNRQFVFRFYESRLNFLWFGSLIGASFRGLSGDTAIQPGVWYLTTVRFDATVSDPNAKFDLSVNGIPQTLSLLFSLGSPTDIKDGAAHLGIGKALNSTGAPCGGLGYFSGSIDEVRIYNRLLADGEIKELYKLGMRRPHIFGGQ